MNSDRIKEIQETTAYPESVSVKQALLQVWNECEQEQVKNCSIPVVINRRELLVAFNKEMAELHSWFLPAEDSMIDEFLSNQ